VIAVQHSFQLKKEINSTESSNYIGCSASFTLFSFSLWALSLSLSLRNGKQSRVAEAIVCQSCA